MAISMHDLSVKPFSRWLTNLSVFIDKAAAHAEAKKFDGKVLVEARLAPDMLPFASQVRIACDFAKGCCARLAGVEPPKHEDNETTLEELKGRIAKCLDFVRSVKPEQLAASEDRDITHALRTFTLNMKGLPYLTTFALPNFYFHVTTAYDILRHNGVELGKRDFMGPPDA
ncbi:MAG TPA: DUF1993 domain-containing protein [Steroidobacteraceae bacterium]|nr:DUF1993 domain-containing protein [Steroidobacteraceae bacterium]